MGRIPGYRHHDMLLTTLFAAVLTLDAPTIFPKGDGSGSFVDWLSNSIFVSAFVSLLIIWFARKATRKLSVVPGPAQNFFEGLVQGLYDTIEGIVGHHMVARVFSLLATLFIFIIVSNWFALLPGVGSIGWGQDTAQGFEVRVVKALHANRQAGDTGLVEGLETVFFKGARIGFQRDFAVSVQPQPGAQLSEQAVNRRR